MKRNEGAVDRAIRVIAGLGILSLLAVGPVPGWGLIGVVGIIGLVTGLTGFCPTYTLLGIDTSTKHLPEGQTGSKTWAAN